MPSRPFSQRRADLLYLVFFIIHIPITILFDQQAFTKRYGFPNKACISLMDDYNAKANDFMMDAVLRGDTNYAWFKAALLTEGLVQLPLFFYAIYHLWNDNPRLYPVLLAYSSAVSFILFVILWHYTTITPLMRPGAEAWKAMGFFLSGYGPWAVIPVIMMVDMFGRVRKIMDQALGGKIKTR